MELSEFIGNLKDAKRFKTGDKVEIEFLRTPSIRMNKELGGGLGYGRQVLLWGSKSAGKTSFALQCLAQAQREGKICSFIDAEGTFDSKWATRLGVNTSQLLYDDPKSMDEIDKSVIELLNANAGVILIDSITAGVPSVMLSDKGEYMGASSNNSIGQKARQTAKLIEGWNLINKNSMIIIISQQRKTTIHGHIMADRSTNGQAVAFYSSQVIRLNSSKSRDIKRKYDAGGMKLERSVGREVDWTIDNNKLGPAFGTGTYDFYFAADDVGVDSYGEVADIAVESGVLTRAGAWYKYGDDQWQGRTNLVDALRADEKLFREIEEKVYATI